MKGKLLAEGDIESLAKQLFVKDRFIIRVSADPINDPLVQKSAPLTGSIKWKMSGHTWIFTAAKMSHQQSAKQLSNPEVHSAG